MRRAIQQYLEDPLSELLLLGEFEPGVRVEVRPSEADKKLVFERAVAVGEGATL